ncbi:MAG: late competence development ComFB family protein [Betaproteobacteria bacterium]|nr:late competence development ComFB family protein [Betaproteobacteria bacterium]
MRFNFEAVHNYYERLVIERIVQRHDEFPHFSAEMYADVLCVALNNLPTRYVRHDVDMMFYMTEAERRDSTHAIETALDMAFHLVAERAANNHQSFDIKAFRRAPL